MLEVRAKMNKMAHCSKKVAEAIEVTKVVEAICLKINPNSEFAMRN